MPSAERHDAEPHDATRHRAILTVDLEDYRRQELRDHLGTPQQPNPGEVERQLEMLLDLFDACDVRATFFTVGRLARELSRGTWSRITQRHELGCHGLEHERVTAQGPARFRRDVIAAREALEDVSGVRVRAFRAPYFSADGCDPWFGEILGDAGFALDSSRRLRAAPTGFAGTMPLEGSGGRVLELPFPALGVGPKRLTVIGGSYMRLLPLPAIEALLSRARKKGFLPMVYLHPYDVDATAPPLQYPRVGYAKERAGAWLRRRGRASASDKLRVLARTYDFRSAESLLA